MNSNAGMENPNELREQIMNCAHRCLHFNEMFIRQCNSWLLSEEIGYDELEERKTKGGRRSLGYQNRRTNGRRNNAHF